MSQEYIKGAISCSSGVSYTGSNGQTFVKLQAVGVTNTDGDSVSQLASVEFGNNSRPYSTSSITSVMTNVAIPAGSFIEGPIIQFKTHTDVDGHGWIAYYK